MRPASFAAAVEVGAGHQAFDALVDIAEPLLQPHDRLAVGGEAEMAGLDDAGMDRADRDLVQALAFGGEEAIGAAAARPLRIGAAERMAHAPAAVVEPGALVEQALRLEPEEVADRRARAGSPARAARRPTG